MSRPKQSKQDRNEKLSTDRLFGPYFIGDEQRPCTPLVAITTAGVFRWRDDETYGAFTDRVERHVDPQKMLGDMTQDEIDQAVAAFMACARGLKSRMSPEALEAYEASRAGDIQ
ncbi:MAG: hypothetical protein ACFB01_07145 [Cohaesibacteraceae bacterium]